jgi:hypothetical protein
MEFGFEFKINVKHVAKILKQKLTVYFNFEIMIFLKFNFEFFAIDFHEKMHGKRWAAPIWVRLKKLGKLMLHS